MNKLIDSQGLLGQQLGPYQIESILGEGGMATVYRALNADKTAVALKILNPPTTIEAEVLTRFEREAQMAARLNHPAIVSTFEAGQIAGHAYICMALVEGQTLAKRLEDAGKFSEGAAADIVWQIADALHYAHSQGIVHRDVKPSNILITSDGRILLSDFGVAKTLDDTTLTRTGFIVGTPAYMAPEQATEGKVVDGRADLYALGVVLYQLVTGQLPFQGSTPEVLVSHVYHPPPPPSTVTGVSTQMESIILRALSKETEARFQSGATLAQALARLGSAQATRTDIRGLSIDDTRTIATNSKIKRPASSKNPFFYGGAVVPDLFYGRQELVKTIVDRVSGRGVQSTSIVGERRMGKSSLLHYLKQQSAHLFPSEVNIILIYLDLMKAYCHTWKGLMRALRRELTRAWRAPWDASEDGDLMAFDFAMEELHAEGWRLLLCLDEVENLTQRAEEFNDVLEDWRATAQMGQMAIVTASGQPLADLCESGGLTSPFYNIFSQHWIGLLPTEIWHKLVTDHMPATPEDLAFIDRVAGGQPFFTQMSASHLWQAKTKGPVDYADLYQEIQFQMHPHLEHLWRHLTADEQMTLRQITGIQSGDPETRILSALGRRGIVQDGKLFSEIFTEELVLY
ncbi:MAG: serine/threonine-protein kinase [Chloroflexota bacterium]